MKLKTALMSAILLALSVFCCSAFAADPTGAYKLESSATALMPGSSLTLNLYANFSNVSDGLSGYSATVSYDSSVLTLNSNEIGSTLAGLTTKTGADGINYNLLMTSGTVSVTNNKDILISTLKFTVKSNAATGATTSVKILSSAELYDSDKPAFITGDTLYYASVSNPSPIKIVAAPSGELKITLSPDTSTWSISGDSTAQGKASGTTYAVESQTGDTITKTVKFSDVSKYFTPSPKTYQIATAMEGKTVSDTVTYTEKGSVKVTVSPDSARWNLLKGSEKVATGKKSGDVVDNLDAGSYTVSFDSVNGYTTPGSQTKVVSATAAPGGNTFEIKNVNYAAWGTITATISPSDIGAKWYIDDNNTTKYDSGSASSTVNSGTHTIHFTAVDGYTTPKDINVAVEDGKAAAASATYVAKTKLAVNLTPSTAKWKISGKEYASGAEVALDAGSYTLSFGEVSGYITPADKKIDVSGTTKTETVKYATQGKITVTIEGTSDGRWSIDKGTTWRESGTVSGLNAGTYTITYKAVKGYATPADENCIVANEDGKVNTFDIVRGYTRGKLSVVIKTAAVASEAKWYIDDESGALLDSGASVDVSTGTHRISFIDIKGYTTPQSQTVTVEKDKTTEASAEYKKKGSLTITLTSDAAVSAGAKWIINDTEYSSGEKVDLDAGTYNVSFKAVDGYTTPNPITVTIAEGEDVSNSAAYESNSSNTGEGGSGGGCNAGIGAMALLALVPIIIRKKK